MLGCTISDGGGSDLIFKLDMTLYNGNSLAQKASSHLKTRFHICIWLKMRYVPLLLLVNSLLLSFSTMFSNLGVKETPPPHGSRKHPIYQMATMAHHQLHFKRGGVNLPICGSN